MNKCSKMIMIVLVLSISLFSCSWYQSRPSICDDLTEPSVLCTIAAQTGVKLEDMGTGLLIVNRIMIVEDKYTKEDARKVVENIRAILEKPVTNIVFYTDAMKYLNKYSDLLTIDMNILDKFVIDQLMYPADRKLLMDWLDKVILSLQ